MGKVEAVPLSSRLPALPLPRLVPAEYLRNSMFGPDSAILNSTFAPFGLKWT